MAARKNPAAVALGRKGGKAKSEAKARAVAENGKKGGRPTLCRCGCGEPATTTVRLLREQDRGTAESLGWAEASIAPMRVSVPIADGHADDGIDGYVVEP